MADSYFSEFKTYAEFEQLYKADVKQSLKQELEANPELQSGTAFPGDLKKALEMDVKKA